MSNSSVTFSRTVAALGNVREGTNATVLLAVMQHSAIGTAGALITFVISSSAGIAS